MTEDYVSFETAKLLGEKGFDIPHSKVYDFDTQHSHERGWSTKCTNSEFDREGHQQVSAPTQALVVKWLRVKHKLVISITFKETEDRKIEGINSVNFDIEIYWLSGGDAWKKYKHQSYSDDYEKCTEVAIQYCLENLIE